MLPCMHSCAQAGKLLEQQSSYQFIPALVTDLFVVPVAGVRPPGLAEILLLLEQSKEAQLLLLLS